MQTVFTPCINDALQLELLMTRPFGKSSGILVASPKSFNVIFITFNERRALVAQYINIKQLRTSVTLETLTNDLGFAAKSFKNFTTPKRQPQTNFGDKQHLLLQKYLQILQDLQLNYSNTLQLLKDNLGDKQNFFNGVTATQ